MFGVAILHRCLLCMDKVEEKVVCALIQNGNALSVPNQVPSAIVSARREDEDPAREGPLGEIEMID